MDSAMKALLVAPCGINCSVCRAHLRKNNPCPGCRIDDRPKPVTRTRCAMKTCRKSNSGVHKFCFQCGEMPCEELRSLDERYRTKYRMSPVENLQNIKELGIRKFVEVERERWRCADCGGTVCVHTATCTTCGALQ